MGTGSQLPVTGGIVRRAQIDSVPIPKMSKAQQNGNMVHASVEFK
jgi:hypothetical protein